MYHRNALPPMLVMNNVILILLLILSFLYYFNKRNFTGNTAVFWQKAGFKRELNTKHYLQYKTFYDKIFLPLDHLDISTHLPVWHMGVLLTMTEAVEMSKS